MTALDETTTPAPRSFAVYECTACGSATSEPYAVDEETLRAALEAGTGRSMRLHVGCPRGVIAAEQVTRTGKTIFAVLSEMGEARP